MRYKIGNESELPEPKPDPSTIATFPPQEVRPLVGNLPSSLLVLYHPFFSLASAIAFVFLGLVLVTHFHAYFFKTHDRKRGGVSSPNIS